MNILRRMTQTEAVVVCTNANSQSSYTFPAGTVKFSFRNRSGNDTRYAFATGKVTGNKNPYDLLASGMVEYENDVLLGGTTLYVACSNALDAIYIRSWKYA